MARAVAVGNGTCGAASSQRTVSTCMRRTCSLRPRAWLRPRSRTTAYKYAMRWKRCHDRAHWLAPVSAACWQLRMQRLPTRWCWLIRFRRRRGTGCCRNANGQTWCRGNVMLAWPRRDVRCRMPMMRARCSHFVTGVTKAGRCCVQRTPVSPSNSHPVRCCALARCRMRTCRLRRSWRSPMPGVPLCCEWLRPAMSGLCWAAMRRPWRRKWSPGCRPAKRFWRHRLDSAAIDSFDPTMHPVPSRRVEST